MIYHKSITNRRPKLPRHLLVSDGIFAQSMVYTYHDPALSCTHVSATLGRSWYIGNDSAI